MTAYQAGVQISTPGTGQALQDQLSANILDNLSAIITDETTQTTINLLINPMVIATTFTAPTVGTTVTTSIVPATIDISTIFGVSAVSSGAQVTTKNATFTFLSSGTFSVTHTATNAFGSGTITKQVVVVDPVVGAVPVANFTVSANPTQNSAVTFTDTSTNTPTSWLWNFGDGTPTTTTQSPTHTYTVGGTFSVAHTATNALGSNTKTTQVVVTPVGGGGGGGTSCTGAAANFTVGSGLTLQQIFDNNIGNLAGKTIRVPAGTWDQGSYVLFLVNRDVGGVQIVCDPGAVLRGNSGIEMFGGTRGITMCGGTIEVNGGNPYGEGIYCDATRGAAPNGTPTNGQAAGRFTLDNVTVRPIQGTGSIQRNGIGLWGCDMITVRYCTVHDCGGNTGPNNEFGYGGAGSGISIGHPKRLSDVGAIRVLIDHNIVYNVLMTNGFISADRNGIILDQYHSSGGGLYGDRLIGPTVVSNNEVYDVSGRGIHSLIGGTSDSLVTFSNNYVHGRYADDLGNDPNNGNPKAAIGGYGASQAGNLVCSNNRVTPYAGKPCYWFEYFDGDGPGVSGSGNTGLPVTWINSRTNSPPSGFAS